MNDRQLIACRIECKYNIMHCTQILQAIDCLSFMSKPCSPQHDGAFVSNS
jgi:hypothetical protein